MDINKTHNIARLSAIHSSVRLRRRKPCARQGADHTRFRGKRRELARFYQVMFILQMSHDCRTSASPHAILRFPAITMKSMNTISPAAESADVTTSTPAENTSTEATTSSPVSDSAPDSASAATSDTASATPAQTASESANPAAAPSAAAPAAPSARTLLKQLQQQFPAFRDCLPLAIGIDKQLLARMPGLDRKTMRAALGIHTGSMRYLRAMEKATVRYDLDGTAGAEVTDTHRSHAKEQLQQRFKKEAERKKAEKAAAAEAEAARLRQEKLQQLASKFSRS